MTKDATLSHRRLGIRCDHWLDVMDELNIGAFVADRHRRITAMNLSAQALLGLRENEVVRRDCREVYTGVPCTVDCVIHHPEAAGSHDPDLEVTDEENRRHLITRMATPIYNGRGEISGCMTILQDHSPITQLIDRLHYEERSLKIILNNLDVGIFTVNRGGLINFFNRAAETVTGYDRHQVLGQPCAMVFPGEDAADLRLLKESIASGETRSSRQGCMVDRDGVTIPIRANYIALRNEKDVIVGGLATFHDMTLAHQLNRAISNRYTFHDMIGKDPAMRKIFEMVSVVAPSEATVLIEGATGTGKDLLAKVIHSASPRRTNPMVKVNCAAIPENLIESEVFGYVKGAFTGADRDKPGRFSEAQGGTIFLDEIGDLPLSLQAKLLRVLEGQGVLSAGVPPYAKGGCTHRLGHQPAAQKPCGPGVVSRGPVLPAQRHAHRTAPAEGAARRSAPAHPPYRPQPLRRQGGGTAGDFRRHHANPAQLRLSGQRPRTGKHSGTRFDHLPSANGPPRTPARLCPPGPGTRGRETFVSNAGAKT